MSRIGRAPIVLPQGVDVELVDRRVMVNGPKGSLDHTIPQGINVRREDGTLFVERISDHRLHRSLHGLTRTLVNNMVLGVTQGFDKRLEIVGTGYRAQVSGSAFTISVGFSHPVVFPAPDGIQFSMDGPRLVVSGIDKQLVGEVAAQIRRIRPPEPYKGKGIRYQGEVVRRKAGKVGSKKR